MRIKYLVVLAVVAFMATHGFCSQAIDKKDSLLSKLRSEDINDSDRYDILCTVARIENDGDSILAYSDRALQLAEQNNLLPTRALLHKGNGYLLIGNSDEALNFFFKAARIEEENDSQMGLGIAYLYISDAYRALENYENAISYLKKALQIFQSNDNIEKYAATLLNLGFQYYKIQKYDSALTFLSSAHKKYLEFDHTQGIAYSVGNKGLVYSKTERLDSAEIYLTRSIRIKLV